MLTVPDEVKALLHLDTCKKNIRIHFPNGERTDICNNLIVLNTVSFKESLCSQEKLKFGLSEASVFECEVVGVGNIKGAKIEVFNEVFCESSVSGSVFRADLQAYVYPISYGFFLVDSCKRQGDIQHRKIVAYSYYRLENVYPNEVTAKLLKRSTGISTDGVILEATNFEVGKTFVPTRGSTALSYDPVKRMYARLGVINDPALTYTYYWPITGTSYQFNYITCFNRVLIEFFYGQLVLTPTDNNIYKYEFDESSYSLEEIYDWVYDKASAQFSNPDLRKELKEYLYTYFFDPQNVPPPPGPNAIVHVDPYRFYLNGGIATVYNDTVVESFCGFKTEKTKGIIYPYNKSGNSADNNTKYVLDVPYKIKVTDLNSNTILGELNLRPGDVGSAYTVSCNYFGLFTYIQNRIKSVTMNGIQYYMLDNSEIDVDFYQNFLNAYYELRGVFGKVGRDQEIGVVDIKRQFGLTPGAALYPSSTLYPQSVTGGRLLPPDYQTCWYDDEYTQPIGAVSAKYKNGNNEDLEAYVYLTGYDETTNVNTYSVYDMSNNDIIKSNVFTQVQIEALLTAFGNVVGGVSYMPVDFKGRGLPYVESGDTFEILTKSNDAITTIVLNRTLTGEQTLTDNYKSTGTGANGQY